MIRLFSSRDVRKGLLDLAIAEKMDDLGRVLLLAVLFVRVGVLAPLLISTLKSTRVGQATLRTGFSFAS